MVKANLRVGGVRLLDRVMAAVSGAGVVLVAHGGVPVAALELPPGVVPVADWPADVSGPLAGVAGAIAWCRTQAEPPDFLLSVAVDTPFFPHDFLARALAAIGDGDAVVGRFGEQDYPTNALWRLRAVADVPERIAGGRPGSLKRLLEGSRTTPLPYPGEPAENPFANANTPADLKALEARARDRRPQFFGVGNPEQTG